MPVSADTFRGCLLGVGIGDAMGYPVENYSQAEIKREFGGYIRGYEQSRRRKDLKPGSVTDDTQMTLCIAESIAECGGVNPDDIARRFVKWLDYGVGMGMTCMDAVKRIEKGTGWRESGLDSAGNGAAMRVAPIGLLYHGNKNRLVDACTVTSRMTHTDARAIAAAVAVAGGVANCLHVRGAFDAERFVGDLVSLTRPISAEFSARLARVLSFLDMDALGAMEKIKTGGFALESVPAAIYAFVKFHDSFANTVLIAINAGGDADTIGSIAGSLAGAYLGRSAIQEDWINGLQETYRSRLVRAADSIYSLSK